MRNNEQGDHTVAIEARFDELSARIEALIASRKGSEAEAELRGILYRMDNLRSMVTDRAFEILSARQVGRILHLSEKTVKRKALAGEFGYVRLDGRGTIGIPRAEIGKYITAQTVARTLGRDIDPSRGSPPLASDAA